MEGAKIIAHGKNLKSVYSQIEVANLEEILFAKVPGNETMIL